jgi:hypothetical protein
MKMIYNNTDFYNWLIKDTSEPFKLEEDKNSYSRGKELIKIKANEEYYMLMEYSSKDFGNLKDFYYGRNYSNIDHEGFYFPKINTIILEGSYEMEKIVDNCTNDIKVFTFGKLEEELFKGINEELLNREKYLIEAFKNETELIEEKKKTHKDKFFREYVGKDESENSYLSDSSWKNIKNRQIIYDYLKDTENYIVKFVDTYLLDEKNLERIKHIICYGIAREQVIEEIKDKPYTKKVKFIQNLFKNELENAKKIWIYTNNSSKQIDKSMYDLGAEYGYVGGYWEKTDIMTLTKIKFSRKEYEIPKFD